MLNRRPPEIAPSPVLPVGRPDDDRWRAVLGRDRSADGTFVYAVRTTGVYCRPVCPARRPNRDNVRFFADSVSAERAGFRPCRRCRPQDDPSPDNNPALPPEDAVARACRLIEAADRPPSLEGLSAAVGLSRAQLHRSFVARTGLTPHAYAAAERDRRVRAGLAAGRPVTAALHDAGYQSSGRFYQTATEALGMTPTKYRAGGAGETIRYAVEPCWLGRVLVAATGAGVCAVFLGDDPEGLAAALAARFPGAERVRGDAGFADTVAAVVAAVESPGTEAGLPLDLRGTAFQHRVWQALRAIPHGRTATYRDIAAAIGRPAAVRAVAQACGANPVAVAVPCHRVVRTDGSLSGYRWGVGRKRLLLDREAARRPGDPPPATSAGAGSGRPPPDDEGFAN